MSLAVTEGKTKYMLSTCRDARRIDTQVTADNYTFEEAKEFIYLGSAGTVTRASLWRRGFDPIKHVYSSLESVREISPT